MKNAQGMNVSLNAIDHMATYLYLCQIGFDEGLKEPTTRYPNRTTEEIGPEGTKHVQIQKIGCTKG